MRIVFPVKRLDRAKSRLGRVLSPGERAGLVRGLLNGVIAAALPVAPVSVVTADATVAATALAAGAEVILEPRVEGLDASARLARDCLRWNGEVGMLIASADLPDVVPADFRRMIRLCRADAVVIAPAHDGGTNALAVDVRAPFTFAYGLNSFDRHCRLASRAGLDVITYDSPTMRHDIDVPPDLVGRVMPWAVAP